MMMSARLNAVMLLANLPNSIFSSSRCQLRPDHRVRLTTFYLSDISVFMLIIMLVINDHYEIAAFSFPPHSLIFFFSLLCFQQKR